MAFNSKLNLNSLSRDEIVRYTPYDLTDSIMANAAILEKIVGRDDEIEEIAKDEIQSQRRKAVNDAQAQLDKKVTALRAQVKDRNTKWMQVRERTKKLESVAGQLAIRLNAMHDYVRSVRKVELELRAMASSLNKEMQILKSTNPHEYTVWQLLPDEVNRIVAGFKLDRKDEIPEIPVEPIDGIEILFSDIELPGPLTID